MINVMTLLICMREWYSIIAGQDICVYIAIHPLMLLLIKHKLSRGKVTRDKVLFKKTSDKVSAICLKEGNMTTGV